MARTVAADTGGTFTDLVTVAPGGRGLMIAKALTTYDAPTRGLLECFARADVRPADVDAIKFGTTLVINAFLQRRGSRAALVCTTGFRDVLEIRRGNRVEPFDLRYTRDPLLIPRELRFEVDGRVSAFGEVEVALDEAALVELARTLRDRLVDAVAVSLMNAYANDIQERRAVDILRDELPGVFVTGGVELTREWYEYERASTAAANAYVGPVLDRFLDEMDDRLRSEGLDRTVYLMASNGGVFSLREARRQPVQLVESGPVGGCIGAAAYARVLGLSKVIAFDMGGTTAKCALIEDGKFETRSPYYVGGLARGFPIRGAVVDIVEVGAGGGSIAALDAYQRLTVGPRSAGSTPGPACYLQGGEEPTITDANVALGRIGEFSFLGGEMRLDRAAAERALHTRVGQPLGYGVHEVHRVAQGVLDIAALTMGSAISTVSTERGLDPRDFALLVFGGGGPLHGVDLARRMSIPLVIVPPYPGVFSAVGMLLADGKSDETRTFLRPLDDDAVAEMDTQFGVMEAAAAARLADDAGDAAPVVERFADLRYKGQRHALKTAMGDASSSAEVRRRFLDAYRTRFGHGAQDAPLEIVGLAVTLTRPMNDVTPATIGSADRRAPSEERWRDVYVSPEQRWVRTRVVQRDELKLGFTTDGPLVVEEYGSSTVIGPADSLRVGAFGELWIEVRA